MAKKVVLDVDADVTKAKRKVREVVESGGGTAPGGSDAISPAAEKAATALSKAAKSTQELGEKSKASADQLVGMTRAFTGLAVGMAATYAARQFGEDSTVGRAIGYVGSAVSGGSAGAMAGKVAGPYGMVAGAVIGTGAGIYGQYASNSKADEEKAKAEKELREANLESIEVWEKARARTQAFKEELERLTKSESGLKEALAQRKKVDEDLAEKQRAAIGDSKQLARLNRDRQTNAGEMDALAAALKSLTSAAPASIYRASMDATDSLARIGGSMGAGNDMATLARTSREQLSVLKSIDGKAGKGGVWA